MSVHILVNGFPGSGRSTFLQALETGSVTFVDKSRTFLTLHESDHCTNNFQKKSQYKSVSSNEASAAQRKVIYDLDPSDDDFSFIFLFTSMLDWNLETVSERYQLIRKRFPDVPIACLINKCDAAKTLNDDRREYLLQGIASFAAEYNPFCVVSMSALTGENLYLASLLALNRCNKN
jgi:GTP1/Obg family GTP-binding protein